MFLKRCMQAIFCSTPTAAKNIQKTVKQGLDMPGFREYTHVGKS